MPCSDNDPWLVLRHDFLGVGRSGANPVSATFLASANATGQVQASLPCSDLAKVEGIRNTAVDHQSSNTHLFSKLLQLHLSFQQREARFSEIHHLLANIQVSSLFQ